MNLKLVNSRLALVIMVGVGTLTVGGIDVQATELVSINLKEPYAIYSESYDATNATVQDDTYLTAISEEYMNRAFADMDGFAYVRSMPDSESDWVGKLYPKNLVTVVEINSEWTKIISGNVQGYVATSELAIGHEAYQRMDELYFNNAKVTASALNVRSGPGTNNGIVGQVKAGDQLTVLESEEYGNWVKISYQEQESYVHGDYLVLEQGYTFGESRNEEEARLELERLAKEEQERKANTGNNVALYAQQFIGNPYVYGGTSLTNGADCSGFVQSVYKHFGISLPRGSSQQRSVGTSVSYTNAQPGDIICYSGHVGIYIGDGKIVNALNSKKGIVIKEANFDKIISVRRVL